MITKEQLQAMSDFEVNSTLADFINVKWQISAVDDECLMVGAEVLDYCNNPSDIMPLAFANFIGVTPMVARWKSYKIGIVGVEFEFEDKNTLRAIACCLILVLQELNA